MNTTIPPHAVRLAALRRLLRGIRRLRRFEASGGDVAAWAECEYGVAMDAYDAGIGPAPWAGHRRKRGRR